MYRLSTLTSFYITRIQMLSKQKCRSAKQIQPTEQTCTFCKQISHALPLKVMGLTRSLSTTPSTAPVRAIRKKRKSRKAKQYIELLEVTGLTSNDTTASVKQLKAKHLTQFVDGDVDVRKPKKVLKDKVPSPVTDLFGPVHCSDVATQEPLITFDHLQSFEDFPIIFFNDKFTISTDSVALLKEIRDSYSKFRDSSVIDRLEEFENELPEAFQDLKSTRIPEELLEEIDLNTLEHLESIDQTLLEPSVSEEQTLPKEKSKMLKVTSKKNVRNQMAKRKQDLLDKTAKEESISKNLYAYLDLCVASNLLNRGLATLTYYRTRGHASNRHNSFPRIVDRNLYNILLHGFAGKGNLEKVQEILSNLREERIPWNEQTFAAVLECLGRNPPSPENNKQIAKYRSEAKSKGFSLNRIVDKSKFTADQRETVISAIRRLEPEFTPVYTPPPLLYNCDLVSELNRNIPLANGLNTNRSEVDSNSLYTNHEFIFHPQELKNVAKEQLKIELEGVVKVKSIEKKSKSKEMVLHYRKKLEELESSWRDTICAAFRRDLNSLKAQHSSLKVLKAISLYPYLNVLEVPQYAEIIMREVRRLSEGSESFSPTVKQLYRELGSRVQARYQIELRQKNGVLDKVGDIYFKYCDGTSDFYSKLNKFQRKSEKDILATNNARQRWQVLVHQHNYGPSVDVEERVWPQAVLLGVGQFLYNILMRDLKVDVNCVKFNSKQQNMLPAFYTLFRSQGRIVKEEVKPHPIIAKLQRGCQQELLSFEPNMVPMLCPPVPWTSITSGGYIIAKTDIMRMPTQAVQQWHTLKATPVDQLYPPLDCLNQLGSIPWRVNQPVLDVILEVFNAGGSDKLEVPRPPSSLPSPAPIPASATKTERFQAYRNRISFKRRQGEMYSLWCDALYKLSLANHLRDRIFWLPHNMDFRGRVYPCPPHLNHLGSDLARSMLMFGTGKPLGSNGLEWLKLHCVNLTGTMKRQSVNERLLYAEEIMSDILDSADNPLHGRRWWTESDEPWQTLACCKEIAKACRSPNPEEYISCFPVHQDGSCNGLQHYAALGRDSAGAFSVNLTPAKSPQDVYSAVASLVETARIRDSENGIRVAQVLEGHVRRKVIKQTVMTTVYGVTRYGARLQIARQLKDIDNFPKDFVWAASSYLTARTFESLREMFTSTKEIQDWFTECARLISAVCGQNVEWVTPLGLPVVQPYHRFRKLDGSKTKMPEHFTMDMFERPNVMKQKNAFPPNFIHSLDSCHMMLTSLFCERAGITFVSVHDCFWTHPCDVHIMNKVCREQFVALHSLPILENLSIFLQNKFSYNEESFANDGSVIDLTKRKLNRIFLQLPSTGDFDLNNVLKSTYFFS